MSQNHPMKNLLRNIRSIPIINRVVRNLIKVFPKRSGVYKKLTMHWPVAGKVRADLGNGAHITFDSNGHLEVPKLVYWHGINSYEGKCESLFFELSRNTDVIIDVGANIGYYSLLAGAANPTATIWAFEPVPKIFNRLNKNVAVNKYFTVHTSRIAISNQIGQSSFYVPKSDDHITPQAASMNKEWYSAMEEIKVETQTLDHFFREHELSFSSPLIKLDCEHHELEVLQGMSGILDHYPIILFEMLFEENMAESKVEFQHEQITALLISLGYHIYGISESGLHQLTEAKFIESRNFLACRKKLESDFHPFEDMGELAKFLSN